MSGRSDVPPYPALSPRLSNVPEQGAFPLSTAIPDVGGTSSLGSFFYFLHSSRSNFKFEDTFSY